MAQPAAPGISMTLTNDSNVAGCLGEVVQSTHVTHLKQKSNTDG